MVRVWTLKERGWFEGVFFAFFVVFSFDMLGRSVPLAVCLTMGVVWSSSVLVGVV